MRRAGFRSAQPAKRNSRDYGHRVAKLQRPSDIYLVVAFCSGPHDGSRCSALGGTRSRCPGARPTGARRTGSPGAGAGCTSRTCTGRPRKPCPGCSATGSTKHGPRNHPWSLLPECRRRHARCCRKWPDLRLRGQRRRQKRPLPLECLNRAAVNRRAGTAAIRKSPSMCGEGAYIRRFSPTWADRYPSRE